MQNMVSYGANIKIIKWKMNIPVSNTALIPIWSINLQDYGRFLLSVVMTASGYGVWNLRFGISLEWKSLFIYPSD